LEIIRYNHGLLFNKKDKTKSELANAFASTLPKPQETTHQPKLCQKVCKANPEKNFNFNAKRTTNNVQVIMIRNHKKCSMPNEQLTMFKSS